MTAQVLEERLFPLLWKLALDGAEFTDYVNVLPYLSASSTSFQDLNPYGNTARISAGGVAIKISSDNAGDTGTVKITGLDANYILREETVTLVGQTKTSVGVATDWLRVLGAEAVSASLVGEVYIYQDDTITSGVPDNLNTKGLLQIVAGFNRAVSGLQTVPAGKVGLVDGMSIGTGGSAGAVGRLMVYNSFGAALTKLAPAGQAGMTVDRAVPIKIEEKVDYKFQGRHVSGSAAIMSGTVPVIYVDLQ